MPHTLFLLSFKIMLLYVTGFNMLLIRTFCIMFQTPHLVNLNEDPLMSECLLYYIKDGITRLVKLFIIFSYIL